MAQNGIIDRENELKKNFISAVNKVFNLNPCIREDNINEISTEQFVFLKTVLSNINNIVTLKVTNLFIDKLYTDRFILEGQKGKMMANVNGTRANANGYDVVYTAKNNNEINILAEVKCNIPVEGGNFGANQKKGIKEDIKGLLNGKNKQPINGLKNYFKFMVLMDYEYENHNVRESVKNLLKNTQYKVKYYDENCHDGKCQLDNDHVYIIFISSEKK
jgi:hypothetical protein